MERFYGQNSTTIKKEELFHINLYNAFLSQNVISVTEGYWCTKGMISDMNLPTVTE